MKKLIIAAILTIILVCSGCSLFETEKSDPVPLPTDDVETVEPAEETVETVG